MSTKSTIHLSKSNEHWYSDYVMKEAIILEFSKEHKLIKREDGSFEVEILEGTDLYHKIKGRL